MRPTTDRPLLRRVAAAWLTGTALTVIGSLAIPVFMTTIATRALADGGTGGNAEPSATGIGGAGGVDNPTGVGGNGADGTGVYSGGGGGGAGATGGGLGGLNSQGQDPGGTGGVHGFVGPGLPGTAAAGSVGGNVTSISSAGGSGGGAGGYGAVITGAGTTATLGVAVTGGNGGNGGDAQIDFGGSGGSGGVGLLFTNGSLPTTLTVNAAVSGGDGGSGGASGVGLSSGAGGPGGAGIVGSNLAITNASTISGGRANNGAGVRADAITFTGGSNFLTLTSGGITGTLNGDIGVTGTLTIDPGTLAGATVNLNNIIHDSTGAGALIKTGAGTLTLEGTNTYTGATTISAGTLALSGNGTVFSSSGMVANGTFDISASSGPFVGINALSGTGAVTLGNNGLFIFNAAGEFSGAISGTGGLEIGGGTQTLSGANAYTNITQIDGGATLALKGAGSIASSAGVSFAGAGTFDISQTTSGTSVASLASPFTTATVNLGSKTLTITRGSAFAGVIADGGIGGGAGGALTIATNAIQRLSGTNTYTGATTIAAGGELQLSGANGSISSSSGVITNGIFDISQRASGTTIKALSGAATGQVFLGGLPLAITNGTGDFAGVIADNGALGGVGGSLAVNGGRQTLSGINTYTGATTVNGGTLSVNGAIATSAVTVNAGGTLGGNGIVGATTINDGTLSPGNSIGTLTVQGNLVFTTAASYLVEVSPSNADRVNVTGTATLGGATVNASFANGSYVVKQYTIVNATGGVVGTFGAQINTNLPTGFKSNLSYDANNAFLNLALGFIPPQGGFNGNQQTVVNTLVDAFDRNGGIPLVFSGLTPAGLTQISGETATGSQQTTFDAMSLFMGVLTDPFLAGRNESATQGGASSDADDALGYAGARKPADALAAIYTKASPRIADPYQPRWSIWAAGYGGGQTTDGNAALGSNTATSRIAAGVVGLDYRFSPATLAGFAMAGGGTGFSVANGGTGRGDLFQAGAFVRHVVGPAYLSAALAYGWQDITTDRTVTVAGLDRLNARFNANAFSGRAEGGTRFMAPLGGIGLTPYAAAQFTTFDLPAYAERALVGANTVALAFASRDVTASRSEFGLRSDKSYLVSNGIVTLRGRAAWAHDYNDDRSIQATFQTLPGASFVVNGARPASNSALTTASAEMTWRNGWSATATFEGEFSNVTRSYAGKGTVRYAW